MSPGRGVKKYTPPLYYTVFFIISQIVERQKSRPDVRPGLSIWGWVFSGVIRRAAYAARVSENFAYGVRGVKFGPAGSPAGR